MTNDIFAGIKSYIRHEFSSGSTTGKDFNSFNTKFKNCLKKGPRNVVPYSKSHYYISGFLERDGKYVYFSVSDVRGRVGEWARRIMIRTATGPKDYSGGMNNWCDVDNFVERVERLFNS